MSEKLHGNAGNKNAVKRGGAMTGFSGRCLSVDKARWVKCANEPVDPQEKKKLTQWMIEAMNEKAQRERPDLF